MIEPQVVVVGGGISGLVATHSLKQGGVGVVLVEKSSRLGGKVVTEHDDGFLIEGGPDSFVAGKTSVLELARELGLEGQVISSRPEHRGSHVWWQGELHPLPGGLLLMVPSRVRPLLGSSLLSWRGRIRVLADLVLPRSREEKDESLESFVTRRLGREVLTRIAEPLIAGIHAAEPATMSLRASFPRFIDMEREHRSLILAARSAASRSASGNGLSHFASFERGMGQLSSALVAALDGVEVIIGVAVTRLSRDKRGGYRLTLSDEREIRAGAVILATPARVTADLLYELEPEAATAISGIHQVATATITLAYRKSDLPGLTGSGFVVPSVQGRRIMGVSYLSQKWEGRVPDPRFALLRAFIGGPHGQELAQAGDDRLRAVVREELAAILGINASPVRTWAHAWNEGLHQYTIGHIDRVERAEAALGALPGVALAGAAFHGIGLNECVESGRRAAASVLETLASRYPAPIRSSAGGGD
ncbi:MAG: protoporphyrinogen oxidase [Acidimicrobiia bacterium]